MSDQTFPGRFAPPSADTLLRRIADLKQENAKLTRMVEVLSDRVERGFQTEGGAFALFQAATILEDTVRSRTLDLIDANGRLHAEIARREMVEAALTEAKRAAELANENKTRFLTAVSHDLQQPLTAAKLMLQSLGERVAAPHRAPVETVGATLGAMEGLLNSLIDISRLEAGLIETRVRRFPVGPMLEHLAAEYWLTARAHGLDFRHVNCAAEIETDPVLLERILRNLLSNAVRYTRKGAILLGCRPRGDHLVIEVRDTGVGIPDNKRDEIFREFSQLNNMPRRREKGLGLGLAIVHRIAGMLDLPLGLQSREGFGSVFSITVPRKARRYGETSPAAETVTTVTGDVLNGLLVAVVENDPGVLESLVSVLSGWNMTAIGDRSGLRTLVRLRRQDRTPDLALLDYQLDGEETGLDAAARLEAFFGRSIPTVILTSVGDEALRKQVEQRGYRLMSKPPNPARLRAVMRALAVQGEQDTPSCR